MSLGTPVLVAQSKASGGAAVSSISATSTDSIPRDSTVFVAVDTASSSAFPLSVTDDALGLTWRLVGYIDNSNTTRCVLGVYYAYVRNGLAPGVTFSSPLTGGTVTSSRHMAVFYVKGRAIIDGSPASSVSPGASYSNPCPDAATANGIGISIADVADTNDVTPNSTPAATELLDYFENGGAGVNGDRTLFISYSNVASGASFTGGGTFPSSVNQASLSFVLREAPILSSYDTEVASDSPASRYKFDETSGTVAADSVGGVNGAYVNSPNLDQPGVPNITNSRAVQHVASSSDDTTIPITIGANVNYSFEIWVKSTELTAVFVRDHTTNGGTILVLASGSAWTLRMSGLVINTRARVEHVFDGQWHCIGVSRNGNVGRIYLDGVCIGQGTAGTTALISPLHMVKNGTNNNYKDATIDDFLRFASVLTPLRFSAHARAGLEGATPAVPKSQLMVIG